MKKKKVQVISTSGAFFLNWQRTGMFKGLHSDARMQGTLQSAGWDPGHSDLNGN